MSDEQKGLSRRKFLEGSSAAFIAAAGLGVASAQDTKVIRSANHHLANETMPVNNKNALEAENTDSGWPPATDAGGQPPFKYSFALSRKRLEEGGWTRQVT